MSKPYLESFPIEALIARGGFLLTASAIYGLIAPVWAR